MMEARRLSLGTLWLWSATKEDDDVEDFGGVDGATVAIALFAVVVVVVVC